MKTALTALALVVGLMVGAPAEAERYCAAWDRQQVGEWPFYSYRTYCARWRYRDRDYESTRVYGYERRVREVEEERPVVSECLFRHPPVMREGSDALTRDGAKISAQDRWAKAVETLRGTRFSDIHNAADMTVACVERVPTTNTEQKQADYLGLRHHICSVEATPCTAPKLPVDEDEITKRKAEKINEKIGRKDDPQNNYYEPAKPKRFLERWRRSRQ